MDRCCSCNITDQHQYRMMLKKLFAQGITLSLVVCHMKESTT